MYAKLLHQIAGDSRLSNSAIITFSEFMPTACDVFLAMGAEYSAEVAACINNMPIRPKIGILDPRPLICPDLGRIDFIIANGPESRDFYYQFAKEVLIYYIYPILPRSPLNSTPNITLGYHGNKIHLDAMVPRISTAINDLARSYPVSLKLFYNHKNLGRSTIDRFINCGVEHIQFREDDYVEALSDCTIGIVPQFMPIIRRPLVAKIASTVMNRYNEEKNDYILRFKSTTNSGRHLVFAQMGIPIIADMAPSTIEIINYGENGYYAYSTASWAHCLRRLASDAEHRKVIAENMYRTFSIRYSPQVQNENFINFITKIIQSK